MTYLECVADAHSAALEHLLPLIPPSGEPIVRSVLESGFGRSSVKQVAAHAGKHPTTLQRDLAREGAPPPRVLVDASKALVAVWLLRASDMCLRDVAAHLQFGSARPLHKLLVRSTGMTAAGHRRAGANVPAGEYVRSLRFTSVLSCSERAVAACVLHSYSAARHGEHRSHAVARGVAAPNSEAE